MVISLIQDGERWGMTTCHHQTPRLVSYELRDLCQFLAKAVSALLNTKEQHNELEYWQCTRRVQGQLNEQLNFIDCGGVAICLEDEIICLAPPHQVPD